MRILLIEKSPKDLPPRLRGGLGGVKFDNLHEAKIVNLKKPILEKPQYLLFLNVSQREGT